MKKETKAPEVSRSENAPAGIRINKFLSEAGVCSRRAADREIEAGNVRINDRVAGKGDRVLPGDRVYYHDREVCPEEEEILIAFHKPAGIVCTAQKKDPDNIIDYINYPKRIYPIGRLDKDSEGLILLTNQGDLVNKIMRAGNYHEKEYEVTVDHDVTEEFLDKLRQGVWLKELEVMTRRCSVKRIGKRTFRMILTQGYNRQIRRMCEVFEYKVVKLVRLRIMNIHLGNLQAGSWRDVTAEEREELYRLTQNSYSAPVGSCPADSVDE